MMNIAVVGRTREDEKYLKKLLKKENVKVTVKKPEVVLCFGGDGTFLIAERRYPGIPKYCLRTKNMKIKKNKLQKLLTQLKHKTFTLECHHKIMAIIKRGTKTYMLYAINDIVVRNSSPRYAIRFNLTINKKKAKECIGDGIIISTAYGSTGYFYSATKKAFKKGFGIAFNNLTIHKKPIIKRKLTVQLTLTRHDAIVCADNNRRMLRLKEKESVTIKKSKNMACLIRLKKKINWR